MEGVIFLMFGLPGRPGPSWAHYEGREPWDGLSIITLPGVGRHELLPAELTRRPTWVGSSRTVGNLNSLCRNGWSLCARPLDLEFAQEEKLSDTAAQQALHGGPDPRQTRETGDGCAGGEEGRATRSRSTAKLGVADPRQGDFWTLGPVGIVGVAGRQSASFSQATRSKMLIKLCS